MNPPFWSHPLFSNVLPIILASVYAADLKIFPPRAYAVLFMNWLFPSTVRFPLFEYNAPPYPPVAWSSALLFVNTFSPVINVLDIAYIAPPFAFESAETEFESKMFFPSILNVGTGGLGIWSFLVIVIAPPYALFEPILTVLFINEFSPSMVKFPSVYIAPPPLPPCVAWLLVNWFDPLIIIKLLRSWLFIAAPIWAVLLSKIQVPFITNVADTIIALFLRFLKFILFNWIVPPIIWNIEFCPSDVNVIGVSSAVILYPVTPGLEVPVERYNNCVWIYSSVSCNRCMVPPFAIFVIASVNVVGLSFVPISASVRSRFAYTSCIAVTIFDVFVWLL